MGFGDIFKSKKNEELTARVAELEALLTPELRDHQRLTAEIQSKRVELDALERQLEEARERSAQELGKQSVELSNLLGRIQAARAELVETDEEVLMQTVGLYTPRFDFANSSLYKEQLASVRQQQKEMVKKGEAVTGNSGLSYEGSLKKGQKVVRDTQKLLLRAFNLECDDIVDRVRFNNIDASEKRILSAKAAISKLGEMLGIEVREAYVALKAKTEQIPLNFEIFFMNTLQFSKFFASKCSKIHEDTMRKTSKSQAILNAGGSKPNYPRLPQCLHHATIQLVARTGGHWEISR